MSKAQRIIAIGVTLAVAYVLLLGGTAAGMVHPEIRIVTLAIATLALGGWQVAAWSRPEWRLRSVFLPVFVLALLVLIVSTAASRSPRVGVESIAQAVILANSYLFLVQLLRRPGLRDRILFVTAAVGVLVSVAYIGETLLRWSVFWSIVGHITTPPLRPDYASLIYGNPSPMLAMAVLLGATIAASVRTNRRGLTFGAVAVALALVAAMLTGTRAGWLGIAGGLVVLAVVLVTGEPGRQLLSYCRRVLGVRTAFWAIAALATVGTLAVAALGPGVIRRIDAGGEEARSSFWVASIRMFADSPMVGVGPGTWPLTRAMNTDATETDFFVAAAHNLYLHTLAETGLLGIAVGVVLALTILWLVRDGLRSAAQARRGWALAAIFSGTYFAIHELLDFHVGVPAVLLAAIVPIAMLDATVERSPSLWRSGALAPRLWLRAGAVVIVGSAIAFGWWTTPATTLADKAAIAGNGGDWAYADLLAREARRWDPSRPEYQLLEGLTAAHVGDRARALANLRSFAEFSDMPEAWVDVAALELGNGNAPGAQQALTRAARLGLQHAALGVAISALALDLGDTALAIEAGAAAVFRVPSLIADPWWSLDPVRADIYEEIVARSLEMAGPDGKWEIELMAGDPVAALAAAATGSDPSLARDVIHAWSRDENAASRVLQRCEDDPLYGPVGWCARIAWRTGRTNDVQRFQRLAAMLHLLPDTVPELRIYPALTERSSAGDISTKAGGSWRNLVLWDVLVPGVVRVAPATPGADQILEELSAEFAN